MQTSRWASKASQPFFRRHRSVSIADAQTNELLTHHAAHPIHPLNLSTLLSFGRPPTPDSVLQSVSYVLSEIPRRLATRVRTFEALPFIVGTNPYVAEILHAYKESFKRLVSYPSVHNIDDNTEFAACLEVLVQNHANDIPTLAKGFQECSRYMTAIQINDFLDGTIRNRISVRLIAEQHIAVSQAIRSPQPATNIGVVDLHCSPTKAIKSCESFVKELCDATLGESPAVVIDGHTDCTFAYVPVHLEYILTEILKNAFRATVERYHDVGGISPCLPPVLITVSQPHKPDNSGQSGTFLSMRIRDQGGGVPPRNMARIFSYAFTTAGSVHDGKADINHDLQPEISASRSTNIYGATNPFGEITGKGLRTGIGTIAGLGYGLPMSRLYAKYFGGSFDLVSMDGWGCDVYVKLRCLEEAGEAKP